MKITIIKDITAQQICDAVVGAFEGGSNYWLHTAMVVKHSKMTDKKVVWWGHEEIYNGELVFEVVYDDPDHEGQQTSKLITWVDISRGLTLMAEKHPWHFHGLLTDGDSITYDVFMQLVVLKDVVYG